MKSRLAVTFALAALIAGLCGCEQTPLQSDTTAPPAAGELGPQALKDLLVPPETQVTYPQNHTVWDALSADEQTELWAPASVDPAAISDQYHDIYSVRIVWGKVTHDVAGSAVVTDWSGALSHNTASMMVVRELIDFEHGQDSIFRNDHLPGIGWRSLVEGDIDGIHLVVYHPKNIVYFAAPMFYIRTEQAVLELHLGQLEKLDTIVAASAEGEALAVSAHRVRDFECPHGPLQGEWLFKAHGAGHFYGKWIASDGQLMGYLRGEFNTTEDGARLFRGKWFATNGDLQGYLHGEWGFAHTDGHDGPVICNTCDWRVGWFRGAFTDADHNLRGHLRGLFGHANDLTTAADHAGLFFGEWAVNCRTGGAD
ncbi:MAG TPA: hypothetical protein VLB27_00175 [candidate division Zixibacteria bacterium]|nr:hypothetical protein [candidate division Zixibacteria bacterium]